MKKDIHPSYHQTTITCACGNVFHVGSTVKDVKVEICSNCHPFYTGKQKLVDTARRVEKFQAKTIKASASSNRSKTIKKATLRAKRARKAVATDEEQTPLKAGAK